MTMKNRKPLFERLKKGLEESVAHVNGEMTLRTVEIPEEAPQIDGVTLAKLRTQAAMSQTIFAKMLNISTKTLQSWEQGKRSPSDASRRLIQIFSEHPGVICKTVGLPAVTLEGVEIQSGAKGQKKIVVKRKRTKKKKTKVSVR